MTATRWRKVVLAIAWAVVSGAAAVLVAWLVGWAVHVHLPSTLFEAWGRLVQRVSGSP
jgi:uncharacterized membrane protein YbhN (UPF0104 family)